MEVVSINKNQSYQSLSEIYRNYNSASPQIEFEGRLYKYIKTSKRLFLTIIYYCPEEQHILAISFKYSKSVFNVQGIYCTQEALNNVVSAL